jgi:glycosyltransferase involved in cell wall biosynthesis
VSIVRYKNSLNIINLNEGFLVFEVTVLVASYNPNWASLRRTLLSITRQKNVKFEIIVCDDGSINNFEDRMNNLFLGEKFNNYLILSSERNEGTCKNIIKGLKVANAKYVKLIAPGDCFFNDNTLGEWLYFMEVNGCDFSFGDAIYYRQNLKKETEILSQRRFPQNSSIYNPSEFKTSKAVLNYIFLNDAVLGANFLTKTQVMFEYMNKIVGKIKYTEDMIYRSMLVDGKIAYYYANPVVWYEFGTGISTSGNDKWRKVLDTERLYSNQMLLNDNPYNGLEKIRFNLAIHAINSSKSKIFKYLIYPELIYWKLLKNSLKVSTNNQMMRIPDYFSDFIE